MPGPTSLRERAEPVAPAHFGGEMPNLSRAFTARKLGTGERRPALIHPCVRLHIARNLGTQTTLHDYHLEGDEVNAIRAGFGARWGMVVGNCSIQRL